MPLTNGEYAVFAFLSVFMGPCLVLGMYGFAALLGPFGCVFWLLVIPLLFVPAAAFWAMAPVLRLFGRVPPDRSSETPAMVTLLVWPLTLAPVHFLNFRVLEWPGWACVLLMLAAEFAIAMMVACRYSRRRWW